ncbi:unnamed protein product [Camellia sinensis]
MLLLLMLRKSYQVFKLELDSALKSLETECEILRNIRHRNLTKVISSCSTLDFKALVLEYMPNGTLEKWLHSHNYFLDILQRLDIMIDVACALEYLHHGYSVSTAHCDLKPRNVLLDDDMVAHVSDFGIAKLLGVGESIAQTRTIATFGYIAPGYSTMLMETFTRTKPTDARFDRGLSLKCWVVDALPNAIVQVLDANLLRQDIEHNNAKVQCVSSLMQLALSCSADSPEERMIMKDVLVSIKIRLRNQSSSIKIYEISLTFKSFCGANLASLTLTSKGPNFILEMREKKEVAKLKGMQSSLVGVAAAAAAVADRSRSESFNPPLSICGMESLSLSYPYPLKDQPSFEGHMEEEKEEEVVEVDISNHHHPLIPQKDGNGESGNPSQRRLQIHVQA